LHPRGETNEYIAEDIRPDLRHAIEAMGSVDPLQGEREAMECRSGGSS